MTSDEDARKLAESIPMGYQNARVAHAELATHTLRLLAEKSDFQKCIAAYVIEVDHLRQETDRLRKALQGVDKSNSWGEADDIIREALSPIEEKE